MAVIVRVLRATLCVVDTLFWTFPMAAVGFVLWCGYRLGRGAEPGMKTPWDFTVFLYLRFHGVQVVDSELASGDTGSPRPPRPAAADLIIPGIDSFRGAVLMNHRSWGDFTIDPYQAQCAVIARLAAALAVGLMGLLGLVSNKLIVIRRGKTSRQALAAQTSQHARYMFYPEGTRRAAAPDADRPGPLHVGGLKNAYEAQLPVLIVVTANKEAVLNERKLRVSFRTTLYRARHPPIASGAYSTFDAFLLDVEEAWRKTWDQAYGMQAYFDRSGSCEATPTGNCDMA